MQTAAKMKAAEESAILPNRLNTEKHRMIKNTSRATARANRAMEKHQASDVLDDVDHRLTEARARHKQALEDVRAAEKEKRELKEQTGIKRKLKSTTKRAHELQGLPSQSADARASEMLQAPASTSTHLLQGSSNSSELSFIPDDFSFGMDSSFTAPDVYFDPDLLGDTSGILLPTPDALLAAPNIPDFSFTPDLSFTPSLSYPEVYVFLSLLLVAKRS